MDKPTTIIRTNTRRATIVQLDNYQAQQQQQTMITTPQAAAAPLLMKQSSKTMWAEVVAYDCGYNAMHQPLFWIQMFELLWFVAFFIVFVILLIGDRGWFNNWVALLIYLVITGAIVIIGQIIAVVFYFSNYKRRLQTITPSNVAYTIDPSYAYANYMGMSHTKELLLAIAVTIFSSIVTSFVWWDWLALRKEAGSFVADMTLTSASMEFDTPKHILEYNTYQTTLYIMALMQMVSILFLIRAIWAHVVPLRSIAHLASS